MQYSKGLIYSLFLHFMLIAFLFVRPVSEHKQFVMHKPKVNSEEIIKGVTIDGTKVEQEISRIKQLVKERRRNHIREQNRLRHNAEVLKQARLAEEKKLAKLKEKASIVERRRIRRVREEQRRLAKLKEQSAEVQKQYRKHKARLSAVEKEMKRKQQQEALKRKQQLERERQAQRKREIQQAKQKQQAFVSGEVDKYKALIINSIAQNWIVPPHVDKNNSCTFEIRLASDGMVLGVKLMRSSGDTILDRSARTAIYKASPLPVPKNPEVFALFKVVSLTVRPEAVID